MADVLAGGWDYAKLQAKTPEERYTIWRNALRLAKPETIELAKFIENSGLEFAKKGGISMDDPRVVEMRDIIESQEGRQACVQATANGLPALAGVEPLIVARMGARYGSFSQITVTAGSLVGQLMPTLGYKIGPQRDMPPGSVAQTAATWRLAKT